MIRFILLEEEIWVAQFAAKLVAAQPQLAPHLAREFGQLVFPHLRVLAPNTALQTVLHYWATEVRHQDDDSRPSDSE